jgi:hypothetical protein
MARKTRRSSSRKMRHSRKHKTHRRRTHKRRTHRRRGGAEGAPVNYHLSGSWPSRMSLGQGADYFKYHEGQHGGAALGMGRFPEAVLSPGLPQELRGPAHIGGIDKAIADVAGLKDQAGGKRRRHRKTKSKKHSRKHSKKHSRKHSRKHSKKHRKTIRRRRGGSLGYAPFPSAGMLLSSPKAYAQAGLNPEWKTAVEFTDAKIRDTQ